MLTGNKIIKEKVFFVDNRKPVKKHFHTERFWFLKDYFKLRSDFRLEFQNDFSNRPIMGEVPVSIGIKAMLKGQLKDTSIILRNF